MGTCQRKRFRSSVGVFSWRYLSFPPPPQVLRRSGSGLEWGWRTGVPTTAMVWQGPAPGGRYIARFEAWGMYNRKPMCARSGPTQKSHAPMAELCKKIPFLAFACEGNCRKKPTNTLFLIGVFFLKCQFRAVPPKKPTYFWCLLHGVRIFFFLRGRFYFE